jgi:hypothetical protein
MQIKEWEVILFSIILVAIMFFSNKYCSNKYEIVGTKSDTSKVTKTKIIKSKNIFTAEQVGKIKRVLIDSLSALYQAKIKNISTKKISSTGNVYVQIKDSNSYNKYVYQSVIDTNLIAKDSSGRVTDSTHVKSTFMSPLPLSQSCIHLLSILQKSFSKETETLTTISNTTFIEKKKNIFERFKIIPNVSPGFGLIHGLFDINVGVGITYEF